MEDTNNAVTLGKDIWNVAEGYTKLKILKFMILLDKYEMMAIYGSEEVEEQFIMPPETIPQKRIEGLKRFKDTLNTLFGNVAFVIPKDSKKQFDELRGRLKDVESAFHRIQKTDFDQSNNQTIMIIDEDWFKPCLIILQDIKEELNTPINDAHLIFKKGSELTIEELEKEIIRGG